MVVYVFSFVIKMQLFWWTMKTNDVLPMSHLLKLFKYFKYNYEIIYNVQFICLDDFRLRHLAQSTCITWHIN